MDLKNTIPFCFVESPSRKAAAKHAGFLLVYSYFIYHSFWPPRRLKTRRSKSCGNSRGPSSYLYLQSTTPEPWLQAFWATSSLPHANSIKQHQLTSNNHLCGLKTLTLRNPRRNDTTFASVFAYWSRCGTSAVDCEICSQRSKGFKLEWLQGWLVGGFNPSPAIGIYY